MRLGDDRDLGHGEPDALIGTHVGAVTLVRRLSECAICRVYLAEDTATGAQRTVKVLSRHLTHNAVLVQRFVADVRGAGRLRHRNVISVHDVGQLPTGAWFMVCDYLDGQTLGRFIAARTGPVPPNIVVHIVGEIANGLHAAHAQKIYHRDLTAENVVMVATEADPHRAVLLEFGLPMLNDDPLAGPRARSGIMLGTPAYMSPEQLRGDRATAAADVFALGVLAYQLSTGGWFPYQHSESKTRYTELAATELYHRQMTEHARDPRERCSRLGAAWAAAILSAVKLDPDVRPASARAFALSLAEALPQVGAIDGKEILRTYARELVEPRGWRARHDAIRPPRSAAIAGADAASRYQLGAKLGTGGMAEVFLGTMIGVEGFARQVAIKRVLPALSQAPEFAAMFVTEARIASRLAHPNIVSVLDFNRDSDGRLLLVMEYVDGKDLASVLDSGPIPPSLTIFIMVELLRGLGYAHDRPDLADLAGPPDPADPRHPAADPAADPADPADPESRTRGVVHRDVSPQNLLLSYEGAVKVSDFGLAKARAASKGAWSQTVRGKPSYMAPEQVSGAVLDGRTDLYAVGVILWEMLARRPLFAGTSREILGQVVYKDVPPPSSICAGAPSDLEGVALKLLARDRDERYPTAEAAIEALLHCADAPRDGRGELVHFLAERFPRPTGSRSQRIAGSAAAPRPAEPLAQGPVTVASPPSVVAIAELPPFYTGVRPRRRILAATISGFVLGIVAATVMIARGDVAQSGATDPGAPAHRDAERVPGPGELTIIVTPWARIWLDGMPSGQTPFRATLPAGTYRVRLVNEALGRDETTTMTVEPDRTATIERRW